jgi:hypothetical protein
LNTSFVSSNSFNEYSFLVFCKALRFHWGIGQPPSNETGPSTGNASQDKEEELPGIDRVVEVVGGSPCDNSSNLSENVRTWENSILKQE